MENRTGTFKNGPKQAKEELNPPVEPAAVREQKGRRQRPSRLQWIEEGLSRRILIQTTQHCSRRRPAR